MSGIKLIELNTIGGQVLSNVDVNSELAISVRQFVESVTKYQNKKTSKTIDYLVRDMLRNIDGLKEYGYAIESKHTASGQIETFKVGA